ncbi:MAG: hypothetical protein U9R15_01870, partial [Chloroflexota bacterium]|nr:hypothetical protein [Chloroflexota bacterium]
TITFASGVTLTASTVATAAQGADWAAFDLPDVPPGWRAQIGLVLEFVPDDTGPWVGEPLAPPDSYRVIFLKQPFRWHVIAYTDGRYVHEFPFAGVSTRQVVVEGRLAGPLELGPATRGHAIYLPLVMRDYTAPWWPTSPND